VLSGDDAGCLNLNRIDKPQLLGIPSKVFDERNAFGFASVDESVKTKRIWKILGDSIGQNIYPAVADESMILWGMGKSIGDTLIYNNQFGEKIYFKLVGGLENSIFQGNLLIDEKVLTANFPDISGSKIILIDCKTTDTSLVKKTMTEAFQHYGVKIEKTGDRLSMFNSVTNTYLDIFISLGILGLIIGTFAAALMLIRSVREQAREYSMLQAQGIPERMIRNSIISVNLLIFIYGLLSGSLSAIVAVFPSVFLSKGHLPVAFTLSMMLILTLCGIISVIYAARTSISTDFRDAVRNE
jgi:ABC-type antimicrobial peptide transport system permease subunit